MRTVLVAGPPLAGKSTYVRKHADRHDLIVEPDRLIAAVSAWNPHEPGVPHGLERLVEDLAARITERAAAVSPHRLWIVTLAPRAEDRAGWQADEVRLLVPPEQVCIQRARKRPGGIGAYAPTVRAWFAAATYGPDEQKVTG